MRRRALRWAVRGLLGLVVLVLLTMAAAAITLHTAWGRDQIRAQIEAKLKPYFPAGAKVGRLDGSVLGDFSIHDIELTDREGRRAITIERVDLNIELGAWLDDEARIEKMIVDGVNIALHQRGSEPPNVATMFQPNPDPLTFDVILERLEVRNAAISITKDDRVDHLDALTIDAAVHVGMSGAVDADAKVRGSWRERAAPLVLDTTVAIDPLGVITVPALVVALGGVKLDARELAYAGATRVAGHMHLTVAQGALAALVPELDPPRAPLELHLAVGPSTAERGLALTIRGTFAGASVLGSLAAQPLEPKPVVGGVLMIRGLDAQAVMARSPSSIPSPVPSTDLAATAVVALVYDPELPGLAGLRGTVSLSGAGRVDAVRFDRVAGGATLDGRGGRFVLEADGDGETQVRAAGRLAVDGAVLVLSERQPAPPAPAGSTRPARGRWRLAAPSPPTWRSAAASIRRRRGSRCAAPSKGATCAATTSASDRWWCVSISATSPANPAARCRCAPPACATAPPWCPTWWPAPAAVTAVATTSPSPPTTGCATSAARSAPPSPSAISSAATARPA